MKQRLIRSTIGALVLAGSLLGAAITAASASTNQVTITIQHNGRLAVTGPEAKFLDIGWTDHDGLSIAALPGHKVTEVWTQYTNHGPTHFGCQLRKTGYGDYRVPVPATSVQVGVLIQASSLTGNGSNPICGAKPKSPLTGSSIATTTTRAADAGGLTESAS